MIYTTLLTVALCCFSKAQERRTVGNLIYISEPHTFPEARRACQDVHRGDLVSLHSNADEAIVRAFAKSNVNATGVMAYYVGYFTTGVMETQWLDGTDFDEALPTWGINHPQALECGAFSTGDALWWDVAASRLLPSICDIGGEVESTAAAETTIPETTARQTIETRPGQETPAPQAQVAAPATFADIAFVDRGMAFTEAEDFCRANFNGSLVSIHNPTDEALVRALAARFPDFGTYWVGYNDFNGDGVITWTDGTHFDEGVATWGANHPQVGECGAFANDDKPFWWDVPCGTRRYPFVCAVNSVDTVESVDSA